MKPDQDSVLLRTLVQLDAGASALRTVLTEHRDAIQLLTQARDALVGLLVREPHQRLYHCKGCGASGVDEIVHTGDCPQPLGMTIGGWLTAQGGE